MPLQQEVHETISRREKAYKYISECSGKIIKADIIRYMDKNGSSLRTTHNIIQAFTKERKIVYRRDRANRQMHWVFINDKDEFGKIYNQINQIEKLANSLTTLAVKDISIMKNIDNHRKPRYGLSNLLRTHFRNLIHMAQLSIYVRITAIVTAIEENIKSNDDRETLYLRLPDVLSASNKLNEVILPEVMNSVKLNFEESYKARVAAGTTYANIVTGITSLMSSNST